MNVIQFILGIAAIIFTWGLLFAIFAGVGVLIQRLMGLRRFDAEHCLMAFWMGLACTILFLQLWHFKMPVGALALAMVLAVGSVGLLWNGRDIICWLRTNLPGKRWPLVAMLVLTIWLANRSAGPCITDDSGVYHLSGVRWNTAYAIVPGLGNLHGRLAFNNASFLYGALLETGPWYGRSNHLANGLLLAVLGAQCVLGGYRLSQPWRRGMAGSLFNLFLLTPLILTAVHSWIASHNTDLPAAVLALVAASRMLVFLLDGRSRLKEQAYAVIFVITVLAVGVCVKVSLVFFFLVSGMLTVGVWLYRAWSQRPLALATVFKAGVMTVLLLGPWAVRGVILSGYPAYPSTFAAMPVPWRVPENLAKWHANQIRMWARRSQEITGWHWLAGWAKDLERDIVLPVIVIVLVGMALLWLMCSRRRPRPGSTAAGWLLALSALMGIGFWFLTAPGRRFGYFLFWILGGTFLAMLFHRYLPPERRNLRIWVLVACLVFSAANIKKFFVMPPAKGGLHPTPTVAVDTFTTRSGLVLYVPVEGSQCWDMQLPCTPCPLENLRLRRKGDLGSGFVLDGPVAGLPLGNPGGAGP